MKEHEQNWFLSVMLVVRKKEIAAIWECIRLENMNYLFLSVMLVVRQTEIAAMRECIRLENMNQQGHSSANFHSGGRNMN